MDPVQIMTGAAAGIGGTVSAIKLWRMLSPKHRRARRENLLRAAMNGEKDAFLRRLDAHDAELARNAGHLRRIEETVQAIRDRLAAMEGRPV